MPWVYAARNMLHSCLNRIGKSKSGTTLVMLGYSAEDLKRRLEVNFKDGMGWDNYGEWHIDHIKPIAEFGRQGVSDVKLINMLCNLRPEWANDNRRKKDKWQNT